MWVVKTSGGEVRASNVYIVTNSNSEIGSYSTEARCTTASQTVLRLCTSIAQVLLNDNHMVVSHT